MATTPKAAQLDPDAIRAAWLVDAAEGARFGTASLAALADQLSEDEVATLDAARRIAERFIPEEV